MLIAQAVFLIERGQTGIHTNRQTHEATHAIDHPIHVKARQPWLTILSSFTKH